MPVTRSQATINGKPLTFETGKYAKQAGGAVTPIRRHVVFAAATVAKTIRTGIDFFQTGESKEALYAAEDPRFLPAREGRPSEEGISRGLRIGRSAAVSERIRNASRSSLGVVADQRTIRHPRRDRAAPPHLTLSNAPSGSNRMRRVGTLTASHAKPTSRDGASMLDHRCGDRDSI